MHGTLSPAEFVLRQYGCEQPTDRRAPSGVWQYIFITPDAAARMLENQARNRNRSVVAVAALSKEMAAGHYIETHQGIAFNTVGQLCDGQHRCQAIVDSGTAQWVWAYFGLSEMGVAVTDTGRRRKDLDRINIGGIDCTSQEMALVKRMLAGPFAAWKYDVETLTSSIVSFRCATAFAFDILPKKKECKVAQTSVQAVLARASFYESHLQLQRFAKILIDGVTTRGLADSGAVKLYQFIMSNDNLNHGEVIRARLYALTQSALAAFIDERKLTVLKETREPLWPIPDVTDAEKMFRGHDDRFMRE